MIRCIVAALLVLLPGAGQAEPCVDCHRDVTPGAVRDWALSRHYEAGVGCSACHGSNHQTTEDVDAVTFPGTDTCGECHAERVQQFLDGKHAKAWVALEMFPSAHAQPMVFVDGQEGCGGCHSIGVKPITTVERMREQGVTHGLAPCDACHTRHTFSVEEARSPLACRTCHEGLDHAQWEMYDNSKHGVRHALKERGRLPKEAAAPTCQTCHMPGGDHAVRTAWGYLGVRWPAAGEDGWAEDQRTILKGLGVLTPSGEPGWRMDAARAIDALRLDDESFEQQQHRMLDTCAQCHSRRFASSQLSRAQSVLREADAEMADAIEIVASLYRDGLLTKPDAYEHAYPDLLAFHEAPTAVERRLSEMFSLHRARTFHGAFHGSPEHTLTHGWAELEKALADIREIAGALRAAGPRSGG